MEFYWVNLGTTHKAVVDQNFLWAPLSPTGDNGKVVTRVHWDNVGHVEKGDLIFCCYNQRISFLAIARANSYRGIRPANSSFNEWDEIGNRVDVDIIDIDRKIHRDEISAEFIERFDKRTGPSVFNNKATLNQIYMAHLPADAGLFLLEAVHQAGLFEQAAIESGEVSNQRISQTTREALVQARVGQGKFRADLIQRWSGKCALTGLANINLMVASHIDAWALCDNKARLDPDNGLLLAPHIDRLFDRGLITFEAHGKLQISDKLGSEERYIFALDRFNGIETLTPGNVAYLERHRARFGYL